MAVAVIEKDALDSPKPHKCAYLAGSKTTSQVLKVSVAKRHEPGSVQSLKRHEPGNVQSGKNLTKKAEFKASATKHNDTKRHQPLQMVVQELPNQQLEANLRVAIYDEGEDDEYLEYCPEEAAKSGDLSPMHREKKVNQGIALKQLPMRAAKQKVAAPSTF
nr:uncharacterized protein LOC108947906 [Nicotiana tomentosiformis]